MYQASHLNIRENLTTQGGLMLLESTLYSRLSVSHISSAYSELVLHCYQQNGPVDEQIRAICRSAISVSPYPSSSLSMS
jgi:anaphase-promoting complex subunit 5